MNTTDPNESAYELSRYNRDALQGWAAKYASDATDPNKVCEVAVRLARHVYKTCRTTEEKNAMFDALHRAEDLQAKAGRTLEDFLKAADTYYENLTVGLNRP